MKTKIEWTDRVWNPVTGCTKVSQGCKNCYAETFANRKMGEWKGSRKFTDVICHEYRLDNPLHWRKPAKVFVNSMSDLFHESVPFEFIDKVFAVMALCPQHTFQILTKRPERAVEYFKRLNSLHEAQIYLAERILQSSLIGELIIKFCLNTEQDVYELVQRSLQTEGWPLKNVWLGVSVEDQATADERIPQLLQIPAAVRFLSCEPLLGEIDLKKHNIFNEKGDSELHLVICGGESGHGARPMHPDWARKLRDDCKAAGVPFFFKQWGEWVTYECLSDEHKRMLRGKSATWKIANAEHFNDDRIHTYHKLGKKQSGRLLDGVEHNEFPKI